MTENTVHATYLSQLQYPSAQGYLRQMAIGDFTLENGTVLPQVNISYETWGLLTKLGTTRFLFCTPSPATPMFRAGFPHRICLHPVFAQSKVMVGGKVLWGRARWSIPPNIL
ncbi:Uncharacterised protein [Rothia dentocariosa]|uniref:Uncharacterized protein n=1 Tax=Rothia dentocariosa TaxID=2047 RepID=A0A3S4YGC9_9MICC|nr:Uncharacterised protein [Rothia dentocariosa]